MKASIEVSEKDIKYCHQIGKELNHVHVWQKKRLKSNFKCQERLKQTFNVKHVVNWLEKIMRQSEFMPVP